MAIAVVDQSRTARAAGCGSILVARGRARAADAAEFALGRDGLAVSGRDLTLQALDEHVALRCGGGGDLKSQGESRHQRQETDHLESRRGYEGF
jgi:hypothetical protein